MSIVETRVSDEKVGPTPGPWFARMQLQERTNRPLGWIIEFRNGRIGWSSYATASPNEGEGEPYTVSGANARLIAAAPAMLAALKAIIAENDDYRGGLPEGCESDPLTIACELGRAAIRKAEGKPPARDDQPARLRAHGG